MRYVPDKPINPPDRGFVVGACDNCGDEIIEMEIFISNIDKEMFCDKNCLLDYVGAYETHIEREW